MVKRTLIITALLSTILLTGCEDTDSSNIITNNSNNNAVTSENANNESVLLDILNEATELQVKEKIVSLGAGYDIYADGNLVAEIKGKIIKDFGDKFQLLDREGNVIKEEKQIKRWGVKINRMVEVSDPSGAVTGYIGEEKIEDFFSFGYRFHIYNNDKDEIGYTKEKLTFIGKKFDIYDMEDNKDYDISEKVFNLTSTYNIKVNDNKDIPVEDILFYITIQDAILSTEEAKQKESNENSNK